MTVELSPFDPAEALINDEEIAFFLQDALESGDAGVFASALSAVARAKGLQKSADQIPAARIDGAATPSSLSVDAAMTLLKQFGLALRVSPEATAAAA